MLAVNHFNMCACVQNPPLPHAAQSLFIKHFSAQLRTADSKQEQ